MTITDLRNAVRFLEKVFVGQADEESLVRTIASLRAEIIKREKANVKSKHR
jgi:hypothetical protein